MDDRNSPPPPPTVEGRTETTEEGEVAESDVAQPARARRSVKGWRGDRADGGTTRARRTAALEERGEDPRKRMQIMRAAPDARMVGKCPSDDSVCNTIQTEKRCGISPARSPLPN